MPDTSTEIAIATTTLGSATGSISFTSIPATYTDLKVVFTGTDNDSAGYSLRLNYNSDTGNNYSFTRLNGDGSSPSSSSNDTIDYIFCGSLPSTNIPMFCEIDVFSYKGSNFKTALITSTTDRNGVGGYINKNVGLWRSTSAITSVQLALFSPGAFKIGTTATLYGIL
jgi:hypothetical protein